MAKKKPVTDSVYLTPENLCERWANTVTSATLANWRASKKGPCFTKIGGKVVYSMKDVLAYEQKRERFVP